MRRPPFWLAAGSLAVLTASGCSSAQSSIPPLSNPGPGVFRIYAGTSQSVPMSYTAETLPDGTQVQVGIGPTSIHTVNGKLSAYFALQYSGEPKSQLYNGFWLSAKQSHVVGGRYRFAVLQIWTAASQASDAADIQITER
jgi:hypothetical protein